MALPSLFRRKDVQRSNLPDPETVAMMTQTWGASSCERITQSFTAFALSGYMANSVVFSVVLARLQLLAQAEFKYQWLDTRRLFGDQSLTLLERPWPNGTTADLIARMEQHASLAGNSFVRRTADALVVMRPDWTDIVSVEVVDGYDMNERPQTHREVIGYLYSEGGIGVGEGVFYPVEDVAHWTPIPDPLASWRGMSWMTPVLREINADVAMTQHRQVFFDNAGTPNLILKYKDKLLPDTFERVRAQWQARFGGPRGAGSTVILDEGADLTVVGSTFEAMRFDEIQAAGEARIAAAGGVPAIVAGLQAGLDAATYSNYGMAIKAMANGTGAFLWRSLCSSLSKLVTPPAGARLWYDTTNIPALREDEKDRANAMQVLASAASTLLMSGYEATSITNYLASGDLAQLKHTGMVSVQLYPNGKAPEPPAAPAARSMTWERERAAADPLQLTVNVHPSDPTPVNVQVDAPVVNVERAEPAPAPAPVVNVTVEPTPVTVNTPAVTVEPSRAAVTVTPADVTLLPMPPTTRKVKRDTKGNIIAVVEE